MNVFKEISKTHSPTKGNTWIAQEMQEECESNLMAHSKRPAPFHPFQYPDLLWSAVSELGSQQVSWQKGQKKVSVLGEKSSLLEKKAHCCCLRETRVEKQLQFDKYSCAKEGSLIRGQKQFLI